MASLVNSDIFVVGPRTSGNLFLVAVHMLQGIFKKLWTPEKNKIYEYNLVIYYSLRKSRNKEKISKT